jgi:hypothetical protein
MNNAQIIKIHHAQEIIDLKIKQEKEIANLLTSHSLQIQKLKIDHFVELTSTGAIELLTPPSSPETASSNNTFSFIKPPSQRTVSFDMYSRIQPLTPRAESFDNTFSRIQSLPFPRSVSSDDTFSFMPHKKHM